MKLTNADTARVNADCRNANCADLIESRRRCMPAKGCSASRSNRSSSAHMYRSCWSLPHGGRVHRAMFQRSSYARGVIQDEGFIPRIRLGNECVEPITLRELAAARRLPCPLSRVRSQHI